MSAWLLPTTVPVWIVVGLLFFSFVLETVARRRVELRLRLLESAALAVRRDLPLAPWFARLAEEERGRCRAGLKSLAASLDQGLSFADSLRLAFPRCMPSETLAALAAAEGQTSFAPCLTSMATRARTLESTGHRAARLLAYPAMLSLMALTVHALMQQFHTAMAPTRAPDAASNGLATPTAWVPWLAWTTTSALALVILHDVLSTTRLDRAVARITDWIGRFAWPPLGRWQRLAKSADTLDLLAQLTRAGISLEHALIQASPLLGAGAPRLRSRADALSSGATGDALWHRSGLPSPVEARLAASPGRAPAALAETFTQLAEQCRTQATRRVERLLRLAHPVTVAAYGAVLALDFRIVVLEYGRILSESAA